MYFKICEICGNNFYSKGPAGKFCSKCKKPNRPIKVATCIYQQGNFCFIVKTTRQKKKIYKSFTTLKEAIAYRNTQLERPMNGEERRLNRINRGTINPNTEVSSTYKHRSIRNKIRTERRFCAHCGKDLLNVSRYDWVVHHIDHNRKNDNESNFMLLCKACHQNHHVMRDKMTGRFVSQRSETIPSGSTSKQMEAAGDQNDL